MIVLVSFYLKSKSGIRFNTFLSEKQAINSRNTEVSSAFFNEKNGQNLGKCNRKSDEVHVTLQQFGNTIDTNPFISEVYSRSKLYTYYGKIRANFKIGRNYLRKKGKRCLKIRQVLIRVVLRKTCYPKIIFANSSRNSSIHECMFKREQLYV